MAIGFLLVGPVPFITTLVPTTGLIQGSGAILGTGYSMIMVSTFGRSQSAAIRNGYNDDLDTYMFISSEYYFLKNIFIYLKNITNFAVNLGSHLKKKYLLFT